MGFLQMIGEKGAETFKYFPPQVMEMFREEVDLVTKYLFYRLGIKPDRDFQGHKFENIRPVSGSGSGGLSGRQKHIILVVFR
jgi:hypothetical protein